jgi:hypothetical protein
MLRCVGRGVERCHVEIVVVETQKKKFDLGRGQNSALDCLRNNRKKKKNGGYDATHSQPSRKRF